MAVDIYKPVVNPVTGESFQAISFDESAFVMKWIVQPDGYVPFEHVHLNQDEIFHVRTGEVRLVMDGKEMIAKAGDTVTVPKGAKHIAYNNSPEVLDCVVEYRPGLDHDKFMQCIAGLIADGYYDKKGAMDIPRMGYFMRKMRLRAMARPTNIPAAMLGMGLFFFYMRGSLSGWKTLYTKYTGEV